MISNRQRIANVIATWDEKPHSRATENRYAGYLEALLQNENVFDMDKDFEYKSFTFKRLIFPGTYEVKETYPAMIYRIAKHFLAKNPEE